MDSTPTQTDVIRDAMDARLDRLCTAELGRVVSYDSQKRTAAVQVLATYNHVGEDGSLVKERIAPCPSVPVFRLAGGAMRLSMPVKPGDECLLVFCATPVTGWQVVGGDYDAGYTGRVHHVEGAVAIVGLAPWQADGEFDDPDAVCLGSPVGARVRVSGAAVEASTGGPTENVGTATDLGILLGMWSDPGIVAGIAAAPTDGGTSLASAITAYLGTAGTPSGSTVLKAQR